MISNIKEYYVIIAIMEYTRVKNQLDEMGCVEGEDYCDYKTYLGVDTKTLGEKLDEIEKFIFFNSEYKNSFLVGCPILSNRRMDMTIHFFSSYFKNHAKKRYIHVGHTTIYNQKVASDLLGIPFFNIPDITNWKGEPGYAFNYECEKKSIEHIRLSRIDEQYVEELQYIYSNVEDRSMSYNICILIAKFYDRLFDIIEPSGILIGNDINPEQKIIEYIANKKNIRYTFWEYGWIPGTLFFDTMGIGGRSTIAKSKRLYDSLPNKYSRTQIQEIKEYILRTRIDTVDSFLMEKEENELKKIDKRNKTIFYIGEAAELSINNTSQFWHDNISHNYKSTKEILNDLMHICNKYGFNLLYKPHPGLEGLSNYADIKIESNDIICVNHMSIYRLISLADVIVSLYSAADCKALIGDKPLIQIGNSITDQAGCVYKLNSKSDLEAMIIEALDKGMTLQQREKFDILLGKLLSNYLWDDLDKNGIKYGLTINDSIFNDVS